ncbi:hypothetical protein FM103_02760 [Corynebacterium xerosis]|nr:hypothetical protein FM103_02760 [Corynebacterium xerosis]
MLPPGSRIGVFPGKEPGRRLDGLFGEDLYGEGPFGECPVGGGPSGLVARRAYPGRGRGRRRLVPRPTGDLTRWLVPSASP